MSTERLTEPGMDPQIRPAVVEQRDPYALLSPEEVTRLQQEPPKVNVESLEHMGSMLDLDPSRLDPEYNYHWVHKSPQKVARARARGYRLVNPLEEPDVVNAVGDSPAAADNTYTVGDVVLMRAPKATYKGRKKKMSQRRDQRLKGPERKFRGEARKESQRFVQPIEVITDKE